MTVSVVGITSSRTTAPLPAEDAGDVGARADDTLAGRTGDGDALVDRVAGAGSRDGLAVGKGGRRRTRLRHQADCDAAKAVSRRRWICIFTPWWLVNCREPSQRPTSPTMGEIPAHIPSMGPGVFAGERDERGVEADADDRVSASVRPAPPVNRAGQSLDWRSPGRSSQRPRTWHPEPKRLAVPDRECLQREAQSPDAPVARRTTVPALFQWSSRLRTSGKLLGQRPRQSARRPPRRVAMALRDSHRRSAL